MARIPDDELERLKNDIPLLRLVEAKGFQLVRHGARDWAIKCPFHSGGEEKTRAASSRPTRGSFTASPATRAAT